MSNTIKRTLFVFGNVEATMTAFDEMASIVSGIASAIDRNEHKAHILFGNQQYDFISCNPNIRHYIMGQTFNKIIFDDLSSTMLDDAQKELIRTRIRKGD